MKLPDRIRHLRIATCLAIGFAVIFAVAGTLLVIGVYHTMYDEAVRDARAKARLIVERNEAIHDYFSRDLLPGISALMKQTGKGNLPSDPMGMLSDFALSRSAEREGKSFVGGYHYKLAAINARNSANEADAFERRYLEKLAAGQVPPETDEVRDIDGEPVFVYMGLTMVIEQGCLVCHGAPDAAPPDLVSRYGSVRGFNRHPDQPAVGVVKLPMAGPFSHAAMIALQLSLALLLILLGASWTQWLIVNRYVTRPLREIELNAAEGEAGALLIRSPDNWWLPREIISLKCALRVLAQSEVEQKQVLERTVGERTEGLVDLSQELVAKNAEMESFTYTVSHDLKSPLITIQGFLGLAEQDLPENAPAALLDDLKQIQNASDKMYQLLDGLLELSRIGRVISPSEYFTVDEVAREAVQMVQGQLAEFKVECVVNGGLPGIFGDRLRMREVFQNLLENAIKYTRKHTPAPRIEVGAAVIDAGLACFVRDNGPGIPGESRERVFKLFAQLDPQAGGAGIGLALVRRIIELHGGSVWIDADTDRIGTTVWIKLPWTEAAAMKC